jgi:hypothetical protein
VRVVEFASSHAVVEQLGLVGADQPAEWRDSRVSLAAVCTRVMRRKEPEVAMDERGHDEDGELREEVVWPLGRPLVEGFVPAARPASLHGKVIAEVWDDLFFGDQAFSLIREELRRRYSDVTFVEYTNFGNVHGPNENEVVAGLGEALLSHGVDGVIIGVGN